MGKSIWDELAAYMDGYVPYEYDENNYVGSLEEGEDEIEDAGK